MVQLIRLNYKLPCTCRYTSCATHQLSLVFRFCASCITHLSGRAASNSPFMVLQSFALQTSAFKCNIFIHFIYISVFKHIRKICLYFGFFKVKVTFLSIFDVALCGCALFLLSSVSLGWATFTAIKVEDITL